MYRVILDNNLIFDGIKDFWLHKDLIKAQYQTINNIQIMIFKWYVYQQPFLCDGDKDIIWEFLNDDVDDKKLLIKLKKHLK